MEADSSVVGGRVIKLRVILISLPPRGSEVNCKVVFRGFSVGVVINMLVLVAAGFELAKQEFENWDNLVYSSKLA